MENNENNSLLSSLQVEDDEHESKESVLQRYFLQEWKLVKSLLDDIVLNRGSCDLSSVHKIRSIVRLFAFPCALALVPRYFFFHG